jgi:hypothetical protein
MLTISDTVETCENEREAGGGHDEVLNLYPCHNGTYSTVLRKLAPDLVVGGQN